MKKFAVLFVLAIMVAIVAPVAAQTVDVGVVLPTMDEPRWLQDQARFEEVIAETPLTVEVLFSQGDSAKERQNVETLINKGIKVLIICPQDAAAAAATVELAREAGVKVISYDRLITNTEAVDYYVTFDSVSVGEAQGQFLADNAEGTGNPLYLFAGSAADNNAFLFFEGVWNVLQPKIADGTFVIANSSEAVALQDKAELTRDEMSKIIGQVDTQWNFEVAMKLAEAALTSNDAAMKGKVYIYAPNDGTARSIADAFLSDADVSEIFITGQDAEIASVQYIIDGKQSMTVWKDTRVLAKAAMDMAIDLIDGKEIEAPATYNNLVFDVPSAQSEVTVITSENVKEQLIDSGYLAADAVTGY